MYIPINVNVVDAIIHEWFSFVQAYVLMGYLHGKSYCWLVKRILFIISFFLQVQQV